MSKPHKHTFKRRWEPEQLQFIRDYYGKIKTVDLIRVLGRGTINTIQDQSRIHQMPKNKRLYGENIEVVYKDQVYTVKGFRAIRKGTQAENPEAKPPVKSYYIKKGTPQGRPVLKTAGQSQMINVTPEELRKDKPNPFKQRAEIKPFQKPEGKVLTMISKGLYKYI